MKIGIDISQIAYQGTGVARFTQGLVNAILEYDKKNDWVFFFSSLRRTLPSDLETKIINKGFSLIKWYIPPTLLSFLWNDLHQISKCYMLHVTCYNDLDWFITSDWTEPPLKINKATIVHDLVYLRYPETVDKKIRQTQEKRLSWVKKESKIIFVDSYATKKDLIDLLQIDPHRIVINYPGVSVSNLTQSKIKKVLDKYRLENQKFILTVGKLEPRKNIKRLIETMKQWNNKTLDLVIVGPKGWEDLNFKFQMLNVKWLGYVNDQELYSLYSSCLFFIYPSIWEGFGYPVVEAMKFGTPVACSNTSSLKEIANDAALLFNPNDVNEIAYSINQLIQNKKLRDELSKKGLKRSQLFTWKRYYNTFIKTLEQNSQ